ncbi:MAG TPA: thioredoxin family protein [Spirochaetia bacterium]|nr:thioredoxin family protein [Spirochaetia bacterium]
MTIQILGGGCAKCHALEQNARLAMAQVGVEADVELVTDSDRINDMGVLVTPALAIDGVVKKSGRVLAVDEIVPLLAARR